MVSMRLRYAAVAGMLMFTAGCGGLTQGVGPAAAPPPLPSAPATRTSPAPAHTAAPSPTPLAASVLREQPNVPGPWNLVFSDDFDNDQLNSDNWVTCYDWNYDGCTNGGHPELEWYLPGQVSVADGALTLSADKETTPGTNGKTYSWASGMVSTGRESWDGTPHFTITYGYIAAAIQVPPEQDMFPAFWLMPAGSKTTPPEIDIYEGTTGPDNAQMTLHWASPTGRDVHSAVQYGPVDFPDGYHVFAVDWEPGSITWYIDGIARYRVTDGAHIPKVAMEILINLAVGWPTPPPADIRSARMKVDWVRAWQH
jgi:beta-glucanase (GH16 family)